MAAGLTKKGRATRERIVGAAAELVFEHGPVGTSIEDVRKAAGVSGSQMTHYFRDKRSLIQAVVEWQADVVIASQQQLDEDRLDSFPGLRRWAELNVQRQTENGCTGGCRLGSLAGELTDADDETRRELIAGFDRWELVLRDALRAMYDRGELRPDADPDKLAVSLLAALQGGLLLTSTKRDPGPLVNSLDCALSYVESFAADPASVVRAD